MINSIKSLYHVQDLNGEFLLQPLKGYQKFFEKRINASTGLKNIALHLTHVVTGTIAYPLFGTLAGVGMLVKLSDKKVKKYKAGDSSKPKFNFTVEKVVNWMGDVRVKVSNRFVQENKPIQEELERNKLQKELVEQIKTTRKENRIIEAQLQQIKTFIEHDPELLKSFKEGLKQTKEILFSLPIKTNQSEPVGNSLAEEWRQEMQKASYLASQKTRVRDFLEKNPEFIQLLKEKISQKDLPFNSISFFNK